MRIAGKMQAEIVRLNWTKVRVKSLTSVYWHKSVQISYYRVNNNKSECRAGVGGTK